MDDILRNDANDPNEAISAAGDDVGAFFSLLLAVLGRSAGDRACGGGGGGG